jgi:hypothetical protein
MRFSTLIAVRAGIRAAEPHQGLNFLHCRCVKSRAANALEHVTLRLSGLGDMARGLQITGIMITGTSAMRIRYKQTECTCVVCGVPFIAFSTRAKTCTEVCRKRLSRQRQRQAAQSGGLAVSRAPAAATLSRFHVAAMRAAHVVGHRPAPLSPIAQFLRLAAPG